MLKDPLIKTKQQHAAPLSMKPLKEAMAESRGNGNLAQVYEACSSGEIVRKQQEYPFKGWYAIIARSGREQDAADGFRRENLLSYWPNYTAQVLSGRRSNGDHWRRAVLKPIIAGMIFTPAADDDLLWMAVQRIPYVINMLRTEGSAPATLTNADIETIRRIEAHQNVPPPITPVHNFKPGDKVRFIKDIGSTWPPGRVERLLSEGRIRIEVYLMGRMVPITVLPHQIEAM